MKKLKQHIAFFLLLGFLTPQLASGFHFALIPHKIIAEQEVDLHSPTSDLGWHSCAWHFQATNAWLEPGLIPDFSKKEIINLKPAFAGLQFYVHEPDFNFSLRGPPEGRELARL